MIRTAMADVAKALTGIAARLEKLAPSRRDPERYHVEKSELVHELHKLARALDKASIIARQRGRIT